jgi:hypothetical protein
LYATDGSGGICDEDEEDIDLNRGGEDHEGSNKSSDEENSFDDPSDEDVDDVEEEDVEEFVSDESLAKEHLTVDVDPAKSKKKAKQQVKTGFVDSYRPALVTSTTKSQKKK